MSVLFQFTPLREGRRKSAIARRRLFYFNSRPCVRGDIAAAVGSPVIYAFQFTPLREGRH